MQAKISRSLIIFKRQKPERTQAVLKSGEHHASPGSPVEESVGPVDAGVVVSDGEGASVEPHDDGQRPLIPSARDTGEMRREDVEVEAVFFAKDEEVLLREDDVALYAGRALAAETGEAATTVLHSFPTLGFLWQRKPGK